MSRRGSTFRCLRVALVLALMIFPRAGSAGPWSTRFALPTLNGALRVSTSWNGRLVLGGEFTRAGTIGAPHVVAWNGTAYEPLGNGVPALVLALGTHGGDLYAYTVASGGAPAALRRWDGVAWSTVVTLPSGQIKAICSSLGKLHVAGTFTSIGGVAADNVASFDGVSWAPLGSGTSGTVNALASFGGALYAGGTFTAAGGVSTGPMAKWDGSSWSALGAGIGQSPGSATVSGLFADVTGVVAGGSWNRVNGAACSGPALWDGTTWQCLDPGPSFANGSSFTNVAGSIVGTVPLPTGASTTSLWTGSAWTSLHDSLTAAGTLSVGSLDGVLYLMGDYLKDFVGGPAVRWRRWNGTDWSNPDPWDSGMYGLSHPTYDALVYGGRLVALGAYTYAGDGDRATTQIRGFGAWDGSRWQPIGAKVNGGAFCGTLYQGDLVVGGYFSKAGTLTINGVGRWNGTAWSAFGPGLGYPEYTGFPFVHGLTSYGPDLVACGEFTHSGGASVAGIARWDGGAWQPMGTGFDVVGGDIPHELLADGTDLYVGGTFTSAGGVAAARIARWDGGAWHAVGSGFADGGVSALAKFGGELIAGGTFSVAGGSPANGVARWRNGGWQPMGTNAVDVEDLELRGGALFAAGRFLRDELSPHVGIARWDGDRWTPVGGSASAAAGPVAYCLASFGDEIFLGGEFDFVDGVPSVNIAAWEDSPLASAPPAGASGVVFAAPRPNPASSRVEFHYALPSAMHVRLVIHDLLGREVAVLADDHQDAGTHIARWDGRLAGGARAAGVYEAVLVTDAGRFARKLVWTR